MRWYILFPVLAMAATVLGCGVPGLSDLDMHSHYASYSEAEADGAVRRGWIPDFVPRSATGFQESHNLDTNEQWLTFRFNTADLPHILEKLKPVKASEVFLPRTSATRKRSWWPNDLRRLSDDLVRNYDLYSYEYTVHFGGGPKICTDIVAIQKTAPQLWYWTGPR
jgi:hypothetical protein